MDTCNPCSHRSQNTRWDGPYRVVADDDGKAIESHPCATLAQKACDILNSHNAKYGHAVRYHVEKETK